MAGIVPGTRRGAAETAGEGADLFAAAFAHAAIGIAILDERGRIVAANPALGGILGAEPDSLRGLDPAEALHPDDLPDWRQQISALRAGRVPSFATEGRWRGADGAFRWVRLVAALAPGGERVVCTVEEVGARKEAEARLREGEETYRSIFASSSDGVVIRNLAGYVVEANPAMCELHGYTREEFIGLHLSAYIDEAVYADTEAIRRAVEAGASYRTQAIHRRKDGTRLHVEIRARGFTYRGEPHVLGVVRDMTERVRAYELLEERVAERTRELTALLEVSRDLTATLELQPLLERILDQLKTVVGYTSTTILVIEREHAIPLAYRGIQRAATILAQRIPLAWWSATWPRLARGEPVIVADLVEDPPMLEFVRRVVGPLVPPDARFHRSRMYVPLMLRDEPIGVLNLTHEEPHFFGDEDARLALALARQAAVAIENARLYARAQEVAALEERQRLARELHDSVSQALYGIALGARTARTLLDRDPARATAPLDYVLGLAEAGLAEMRALIFELRPESLETEGLVAALEKQAAALRARHGIAVTTDLGPEPDLPLETKGALYRIAQEATHNTVKHARARAITMRLRPAADGYELTVTDDGIGFDPDGHFPGHLGLTSMRERAARLGGTLAISSAPGAGTQLVARLPAG